MAVFGEQWYRKQFALSDTWSWTFENLVVPVFPNGVQSPTVSPSFLINDRWPNLGNTAQGVTGFVLVGNCYSFRSITIRWEWRDPAASNVWNIGGSILLIFGSFEYGNNDAARYIPCVPEFRINIIGNPVFASTIEGAFSLYSH